MRLSEGILLRGRKTRVMAKFIHNYYSDERLDALLAAAREGAVRYVDPSGCLVGRSDVGDDWSFFHHPAARVLCKWEVAFGRTLTNKWVLVTLAKREMRLRAEQRELEGKALTAELLRYEADQEQTDGGQVTRNAQCTETCCVDEKVLEGIS
jgi:hypothetical protein